MRVSKNRVSLSVFYSALQREGATFMPIHLKKIVIRMLPDGRMTTRNASKYIGLKEKTLAMMRCQGTGPRFIKRGRVFYFKEDLDSWLAEAQRVTSTAQTKLYDPEKARLRKRVM